MQAIDSGVLRDRLSDLSEVFQAKAVSEKGLTVWFNVLREFPTEKVCGVLIGWPRSHNKMPSPNDVWKIVNDQMISEREKKAAIERNEQPFSRAHEGVGGAQAEKFISKMREILQRPKWTPKEHWERVLANSEAGSIGHEYAKAVLMKTGPIAQREPGEDAEELRDAA